MYNLHRYSYARSTQEGIQQEGREEENGERQDSDCLDLLPAELRSQHDTNVGRVKSADPVKVKLKPGCRGPYRPQYPLMREEQ